MKKYGKLLKNIQEILQQPISDLISLDKTKNTNTKMLKSDQKIIKKKYEKYYNTKSG